MAQSDRQIQDGYIFDLMDALRSPVLTHEASWISAIPDRMLKLVTMERMKQLIMKQATASDVELIIFIMTRTFESAMTSEWVDIYTHYACKVCQEAFGEDHWEDVKAPRELTEYCTKYLVAPLRDHIYTRRRKILKERMKAEEALLPKEKKSSKPSMPFTPAETIIIHAAGVQLKLFD